MADPLDPPNEIDREPTQSADDIPKIPAEAVAEDQLQQPQMAQQQPAAGGGEMRAAEKKAAKKAATPEPDD